MHASAVVSLDIVLLGFGARGWEGFPALKNLCVGVYIVEKIFCHRKIQMKMLLSGKESFAWLLYTLKCLRNKNYNVCGKKKIIIGIMIISPRNR